MRLLFILVYLDDVEDTDTHIRTYSGDMKMAHYMKIPPRITFWCQVVATIWAAIVQIAVMNWTLGNIDGVCDL